ncbi:MAG: radical SAM protein [Spirochaetes bacterium]|nr:radical SAM protein [Spirochaetota bacterium]
MNYEGNIIRPPSEAQSMIIQVTVGCSHNRCTFCGTYKGYSFRIKDMKTIKADIDEASSWGIPFQRAFLTDGDVLILPTKDLIEIIQYIRKKNPRISRIGVYANTKAILKKSLDELKELRDAGLGIVYQGIESGNIDVLRKIKKGAFPHKQRECAEKIIKAGILLSQTVLLGIGGIEKSREHAIDTGKHLGDMSPDYASALTVMLLPNTQLYREYRAGTFRLPDKFGLLEELRLLIEHMNVHRPCLFTSNHASNYLPIRANFPQERDAVLRVLDRIVRNRDDSVLRPEFMRAL